MISEICLSDKITHRCASPLYYDAYMEQQRSQTSSKRISIDEEVSIVMGLTIGICSTLSIIIISFLFCRSQPNDSDELKQ